MFDCNTTTQAMEIATNRLNLYIIFSILGSLISIVAVIASIYYNRKQLEKSNERHESLLEKQEDVLKANHEWNRRQLAITELISNRYHLNESIKKLNENINYREQKGVYSLEEIHLALCGQKDHENHPPLTEEGKEIKHHIFAILNHYEYFAVGVKNKIFSEKVLKDSIKGALIKANRVFREYIVHLRTPKHSNNEKLFIVVHIITSLSNYLTQFYIHLDLRQNKSLTFCHFYLTNIYIDLSTKHFLLCAFYHLQNNK